MVTTLTAPGQQTIFSDLLKTKTPPASSHAEAFKKLYFHLYSNSEASRAERLFEEIGKLLLVKMLIDEDTESKALDPFFHGKKSANQILLPALCTRFPKLINSNDSFTLGDKSIKQGLEDLAEIRLSDAPAAILGEAFQSLIGPRMRGDKGQFFTPRSLVKAMVQIASPQAGDKIVDPAAGTGGFLVEAHSYRTKNFPKTKKFGPIIGIDKDRDLQRLGSAMVSIATGGIGTIEHGNSLDLNLLKKLDPIAAFDADIVLTNPPFGTKIGITEKEILANYELGHNWVYSASADRWEKTNQLRAVQDPQTLFLELCLKLLKPGGLLGIVLPEGVFGNKTSGYVWDFVREQGVIEAMIDCPRTTFQPGTDTKTNVVFIRKGKSKKASEPLIAVAKTCGHDRRGRITLANGDAVSNDLEIIANTFDSKDESQWSSCALTDPYYLVPRYYHRKAVTAVESLSKQWKGSTAKFQELIDDGYISLRKGHEVGAEAYGSGEIPFVRTSDISNWEISVNPTNGISQEIFESFEKVQKLQPKDILLVVDGRYKIGRTAILHEHNYKCVVQSHFKIISVKKKSPVDAYELLYIMNRPEILEEMRNLVFIQSTLGSIGKRLGDLVLFVPERSPEWKERVDTFKNALQQRATLLMQLKQFETPEPEL